MGVRPAKALLRVSHPATAPAGSNRIGYGRYPAPGRRAEHIAMS